MVDRGGDVAHSGARVAGIPGLDLEAMVARFKEQIRNPILDREPDLRADRLRLARAYLDATADQVRWLFQRPQRDVCFLLVLTGLRTRAMDASDRALLAEARSRLVEARDVCDQVIGTVVHCLFRPPHELPRLCDLSGLDVASIPIVLGSLFAEPEFFEASGEVELHGAYVERVTVEIHRLVFSDLPRPYRLRLAEFMTRRGRFVMTYFSERRLTQIFRCRSEVAEFWLNAAGMQTEHVFPPRAAGGGRLRLGILRPHWFGGAETAAALAHLNGLDRARFEVFLYARATKDHPFESYSRRKTDHFRLLPAVVADAAASIRADNLDVLLIGSNVAASGSFMPMLCAFRLARVEVVLTLCPATSGYRCADYYLNAELNEPEDAQTEYTERLILIPRSINRYDFGGEAATRRLAVARAQLGLAEDRFLFASGASFYKMIPELLDAWAQILRETPGSSLLLYPFNPNWTSAYPKPFFLQHLMSYFERHGVSKERVKVAQPQPSRAHIHAMLRNADLYLDSFPYSGAVSILDPLTVGCPALVVRGRPARARQSAAWFEELGLRSMVMRTPADYVRTAIALFGDRERLRALREEIAPIGPRLAQLDRLDINDLLVTLAARPVPGQGGI